jgi:hypothetical protein
VVSPAAVANRTLFVDQLILWLNSVPSWLALVAVVLVYEAFAIGVTLLARRLYTHWRFPSNGSFVPPWISIVGGLNALIFAFIIFTVWTNLHAASADVDSEALTVRMLWRDITPAQRPEVLAYARAVIAGWSQLCGGQGNSEAGRIQHRLERDARPATPSLLRQVDDEVDALTALRNRRLRAAQSGVPEELWFGTIVLSWILIAITSFVHPERRDMHLALVACTALALGLLLWVAAMIDYPYCGGSTVTPAPLQRSVDWMLGSNA